MFGIRRDYMYIVIHVCLPSCLAWWLQRRSNLDILHMR